MNRAPSSPPPAAIGLSIDRLSVKGVGEATARRLGTSLERRLSALVAERGLPASLDAAPDGLTLESLDLPDLHLDLGRLGPERAGAQLAEALWTRLGRPMEPKP